MKNKTQLVSRTLAAASLVSTILATTTATDAAPTVTRLTPPSALFAFNDPNPPIIARFLPGQRFDLQATILADAGQTIAEVTFFVDGEPVSGPVNSAAATATATADDSVWTLRAYSNTTPGVHTLKIRAKQSDNQIVEKEGNFEVVGIRGANKGNNRAKNLIIMIGDGMGIAHRTAARLMLHGAQQGKANGLLAMDTFPNTAIVITHSLNSIVTDSSPGAACYSTGNKANNNQQGVFPDDTTDQFDNPRVELIGEFLYRTEGRTLGIVTTSDVFDATPGAFGTHTSNRGAGTGICDQYLDEAADKGGLRVLMGGGRKWFLPNPSNSTSPQPANGSQRRTANDYVLPAELANAWGVTAGTLDPARDLIADFQAAGFYYAPDKAGMDATPADADRLLGLFAFSQMNVALDKINGRRGASTIAADFGFPDQPMLDEMTAKALQVLSKNKKGFTLMVEAASIDKQAHNMDTERWVLDTIEFDRAVAVAKEFASQNKDTLVIVTADHECAGVNIIGASRVTNAELITRSTSGAGVGAGGPRAGVVGAYESAGFPVYQIAADGYPATTDVDRRMLIGYAGNAARFEDWLTNPLPVRDSQQPFATPSVASPTARDTAGGLFLEGAMDPANSGSSAVHTASDIPLSAYGKGASKFAGVMDNTDVFFLMMEAALAGDNGKGKE
jgi:alkaline phosphatase